MSTPQHLIDARRALHKHPGLSGEESDTQAFIQSFLQDRIGRKGKPVGQYGTLIEFDFGEGPSILIRVDIDALPIHEINTFDHKSTIEGVSHKCGHDGHTTIGLGLAERLNEEPLKNGKVTILFQPAEETGDGAKGVLADPNFNARDYDKVLALHNIPCAPLHQVIHRTGSFTPGVHSLIVRLQGKTSHAAEPLKGMNPSYTIADIIAYAEDHEVTDEHDERYQLITPIYVEVGSKDYGIAAGYGEIHLTIRAWTSEIKERATGQLKQYIRERAERSSLDVEFEITAKFSANKNDPSVVEHVIAAGKKLNLDLHEKEDPFPWGEDFGLFTQQIPGAMFGLGAGEDTPALHNPDYDFPDELTISGINMFYEATKSMLRDV